MSEPQTIIGALNEQGFFDDEYGPEDVPPGIGENQEWDQARQARREGYAAFMNGERPSKNPYKQYGGPGRKGWSGYKRRKRNEWWKGWQVAAIREGGFSGPTQVYEETTLRFSLPREPAKAIYARNSSEVTADDYGEWAYSDNTHEMHPTRHDAIGGSCIWGRDRGLTDPKRSLRAVQACERVRRPAIPGYEGENYPDIEDE